VMNSIRIEVGAHQEDDDREYHIREVSRTSFKRTFALDKRFDIKKAQASFENGVLFVEIPYLKDSVKTQLTIK